MSPTSTDAVKSNLGEAGTNLKQAAVDAGRTLECVAGIAAAENAGGAAREQVDVLMEKGMDLIDSAAELVRERPLASFGVAFAAGFIIAKLARSGDR